MMEDWSFFFHPQPWRSNLVLYWLVVWNIFYFYHPNWLSYFSEGLKPPTSLVFCRKITSQPEDDRLPKIGLEPEAKWWRSRCSALLCWKLGTWNAEFPGPEKVGKDRDLWSKNGDLPSKSQVTRWQKHSKSDLTDSTPILEVQTIFLSVKQHHDLPALGISPAKNWTQQTCRLRHPKSIIQRDLTSKC